MKTYSVFSIQLEKKLEGINLNPTYQLIPKECTNNPIKYQMHDIKETERFSLLFVEMRQVTTEDVVYLVKVILLSQLVNLRIRFN